jgi:hypothetical protein
MIVDVHAHYFPKEYIRESGLPADDVDRILHHNAQILLGLPHGSGA